MDLTQIILLIVIVVVASILVVIGVQLVFFLRDAHKSLAKLDHILGDVEFMSTNLTRSTLTVGHLVESMRSGLELAGAATKVISALTTRKKS